MGTRVHGILLLRASINTSGFSLPSLLLLSTIEIVVFHRTDCGMLPLSNVRVWRPRSGVIWAFMSQVVTSCHCWMWSRASAMTWNYWGTLNSSRKFLSPEPSTT